MTHHVARLVALYLALSAPGPYHRHDRSCRIESARARSSPVIVRWHSDAGPLSGIRDRREVDTILARAFSSWSGLADIEFRRVDHPSDARVIITTTYLDGDPSGAAHIAADAEPPCRGSVPQVIRLDSGEPWTAWKLSIVVSHEIGHILGLGHRVDVPSVMHPTWTHGTESPSPADAAELVARYGPPRNPPPQ